MHQLTPGAEALGVSRKTLSAVVNGRANVTPNLALRLARAFGSTPEQWLRLQNAYSLWEESRRFDSSEVEALVEPRRASGVFDVHENAPSFGPDEVAEAPEDDP